MARKQLGAIPANATDAATKTYVDGSLNSNIQSIGIQQNTVLTAGYDLIANTISEVSAAYYLEIPATSTLEIYTYTPVRGAAAAYVAAIDSTASTTYVNLSNTNDQVTVTVGSSGMVLLGMSCFMSGAVAETPVVNFAASGANVMTPNISLDSFGFYQGSAAADTNAQFGVTHLLTSMNPGSTTFKMKYRSGGGTACNFQERRIWALPL